MHASTPTIAFQETAPVAEAAVRLFTELWIAAVVLSFPALELNAQTCSVSLTGPGKARSRYVREFTSSRPCGVLSLGVGCFRAIRNPLGHLPDDQHDITEQETVEQLAACRSSRGGSNARKSNKPPSVTALRPDLHRRPFKAHESPDQFVAYYRRMTDARVAPEILRRSAGRRRYTRVRVGVRGSDRATNRTAATLLRSLCGPQCQEQARTADREPQRFRGYSRVFPAVPGK